MDIVRSVGNSTMRMMDDEAGAQVLKSHIQWQDIVKFSGKNEIVSEGE